MLKKAAVVAATVAGIALVGAPAFASHHPDQTGLGNLHDLHLVNDDHVAENVDIPVCLTNNTIAGGPVAVAVNALNPTFVKDCVDGVAASTSGDHHGG
ncbi:hypothetical protein GCM10010174_22740 [Kutzneria viridogrisea]|uniref:Small secreted domain n=2 Tax=Kutzneria TaxID=43356 RepID=A0ABR6BSZ1_9PSEU|nr:hypothetical protein [Kutzneria albida]AHH94251.1 putative secreted protein [Kutzneria albida DSM 43870]MBA8929918.1 hypothetical protein [Kutzneria viridogrisea]